MKFFTENFKWFVIAGIALLIFMIWKGCGNKSVTVEKDYKREYDSVIAKLSKSEEREADAAKTSIQYQDSLSNAKSEIIGLKSQLDETLTVMNRLSKRIKDNPVQVVTEFSKACDSLASLNYELNADLVNLWNEAHRYATYADSLQKAFDAQVKELQVQIAACKQALDYGVNEVIPAVKRRTELYAGASLLGHQQKPLAGFDISLSLLNRRGQIWEICYGNAYGNQYYRIGGKYRLSFNKH